MTEQTTPEPLTPEQQARATIGAALIRVADNVARHLIGGDGWTKDDACFVLDLSAAEEEIMDALRSYGDSTADEVRSYGDWRAAQEREEICEEIRLADFPLAAS